MKNKVFILIIIFLIICFFPIKFTYKDGGTISYNAIFYKIIKWNRMRDNDTYKTGKEVILFPKNFHSIDYYDDIIPPFAKVYVENNKDKYITCNIGTYSYYKIVDGEKIYALGDAINYIDADYKNILNTINNSKIYIVNVNNIKTIKLYDVNNKQELNEKVKYNNEDNSISLNNLTNGEYLIEFYSYNSKDNNCYYSFKIRVS